ncbi:MAG: GDP-L-fucose synthase family protein [Candidatus Binatia bacterium]
MGRRTTYGPFSDRITMIELEPTSRVFVAGHRGLVGAALVRRFQQAAFCNLILRTRAEVDLTEREAVLGLFRETAPECVIIAAARVGGIAANMAAPVDFLLENLQIQNNLLEACQRFQVKKAVFLGSSCVYPREAPQPMRESSFMHGPLEPTNESYAVAKIAGIRLAQAMHEQYGLEVICPMPCNVYGPGDHFEFERSHVVSALVRRFVEAKQQNAATVILWGTGNARREFLHVDDLADACLFLLQHFHSPELVNVGSGVDFAIRELAEMVGRAVGYTGRVEWDTTKPDGMPRKLLDVTKLQALGWRSKIGLEEGLGMVVADFHRWQSLSKGNVA